MVLAEEDLIIVQRQYNGKRKLDAEGKPLKEILIKDKYIGQEDDKSTETSTPTVSRKVHKVT